MLEEGRCCFLGEDLCTPVFKVDFLPVEGPDDALTQPRATIVSRQERFVALYFEKEHQNRVFFRAQLYSVVEEHLVYDSAWTPRCDALRLEEQFALSADDRFFYLQRERQLLFFALHDDAGFCEVRESGELDMANVHALAWAPLRAQLAVF